MSLSSTNTKIRLSPATTTCLFEATVKSSLIHFLPRKIQIQLCFLTVNTSYTIQDFPTSGMNHRLSFLNNTEIVQTSTPHVMLNQPYMQWILDSRGPHVFQTKYGLKRDHGRSESMGNVLDLTACLAFILLQNPDVILSISNLNNTFWKRNNCVGTKDY